MLNRFRQRLAYFGGNELMPAPARLTFQLSVLFLLVTICSSVSLAAVYLVLKSVFHIDNPSVFLGSTDLKRQNVNAFLASQTLVMAIGTFLVPALLFFWLLRKPILETTKLNRRVSLLNLLLAAGISFFTGIFIQLLVQINTDMHLPSSLNFLRQGQETAEALINSLFNDHSNARFIALTLSVALFPAVCEEFFFRGTIQQLLSENSSTVSAIIVSGFIFSLVHGEFNNFLAIWWMGIMLGYIYYLTQSLWASIAAHFLNNFLMIAGKMAFERGLISKDVSADDHVSFGMTIAAGLVMCVLLWQLGRCALPEKSN